MGCSSNRKSIAVSSTILATSGSYFLCTSCLHCTSHNLTHTQVTTTHFFLINYIVWNKQTHTVAAVSVLSCFAFIFHKVSFFLNV